MNKIPPIAAHIIINIAKEKGILPGIFLAIHTFGRDLKRNVHIHLSTTIGGLSIDNEKWIDNCYFYHNSLKSMWRYLIISLLRKEFEKANLILPKSIKHIKQYNSFVSWTAQFYDKTWVVHLAKHSDNKKRNIDYQ